MTEMLNKYVFYTACLFVSLEAVAQITPGPPVPPPPPGFPVDEDLALLFAVALFFGLYKIYISIIKKKRSV